MEGNKKQRGYKGRCEREREGGRWGGMREGRED